MHVALHFAEKYIPWYDERPIETLVFGNQGTVERLVLAKRVAGRNRRNKGRLIGIEPAPQDFQKRGIFNYVRNKLLE